MLKSNKKYIKFVVDHWSSKLRIINFAFRSTGYLEQVKCSGDVNVLQFHCVLNLGNLKVLFCLKCKKNTKLTKTQQKLTKNSKNSIRWLSPQVFLNQTDWDAMRRYYLRSSRPLPISDLISVLIGIELSINLDTLCYSIFNINYAWIILIIVVFLLF